ncbi:MAG: tRNA epoxyqueuosine(34) reductase QueG [Acidobacteriota bacterium]|nr:tRNA epoxyqueuosine(34) reductase QueG [Acidobacteriota bacterium]
MRFTREAISRLAAECGFELAGVAAALPIPEIARYHAWAGEGFAGEMRYLTDQRAAVRNNPRNILPSAKSIVCVGKLYNGTHQEPACISRYATGEDYHHVLRRGLERLVEKLRKHADFEHRICVDTAPLLERSYARLAGLGWIGKNTCLIHEGMGSWFFLGELLISLEIEPDSPPPDRCGTCTRCIDACPTDAIVPFEGVHAVDSRRCISYFTIELRGGIPEEACAGIGNYVFGCDICQDACPWNRSAPISLDPAFAPARFAPPLERLAALSAAEFREMFADSPVERSRYSGFLRNVAIAMGNEKSERFREPLLKLSASEDPVVSEHARWGLHQLESHRLESK